MGLGIAGTVVAIVGTVVMVVGIATSTDCSGDFCGIGHAFLTFPGAATTSIGLGLLIPGWTIYANARAAESPDGQPSDTPRAEGPTGLRLTGTW